MWQPAKLEQYKGKLEEVKEVVTVVIAVVTIASFVRKRVNTPVEESLDITSQENNS